MDSPAKSPNPLTTISVTSDDAGMTENDKNLPAEPAPHSEYEKYYTESSYFEKLGRFARLAGRQVVEKTLLLYYAAQDPATPTWARATIFGALGYFILPADAIPDFIPGAGFADDLGAVVIALAVVTSYITPKVKEKAVNKLAEWFPPLLTDEEREDFAAPAIETTVEKPENQS